MLTRTEICRHNARWLFIAATMALGFAGTSFADAALKTRNVVLVTLDGVRIQEMFGGLDDAIAKHSAKQYYSDINEVRPRYDAVTPQARREKLMPFFWKTLAPMGIVLGNPATNSPVELSNTYAVSSPGYAEIMTGEAQPEITDNTLVRHNHRTVMDVVYKDLSLQPQQVAEFSSWDGIKLAASQHDNSFVMLGGFDNVPSLYSNAEMDRLAELRQQVMGLWEEGSDDMLTFQMAKSYLTLHQPRLLWIGLGNSDDWGHADRYDRELTYLHRADAMLSELWETLQSMRQYQDSTTLVITTDHGRGRSGEDWAEHDISIPGCTQIWAAVIGPDTPDVGEAHDMPMSYQNQIAGTILQFYGIEHTRLSPKAGAPLPGSIAKP